MIVPMLKYSFLVYHQDHEEFLKNLREIGVVHIMQKKGEFSEEAKQAFQQIEQLKNAQKFLGKRDVEQQKQEKDRDGIDVLHEIQTKREEIDKTRQDIIAINKEIIQQEPWGDFSPENIQQLAQNGIHVHFFICPVKQFDEKWNEQYYIEKVSEKGSDIYFVLITRDDENVDLNIEEIDHPEKSITRLQADRNALEKRINEINNELDEYASKYIELIHETILTIRENTEFEDAIYNTESEAEDQVMLTEGWVPDTKEKELVNFLEEQSVVYVKEPPRAKEEKETKQIPVLLKNNRFARVFELIGNMFLPNYKEIDLTPFFAPFFVMFFGFCLGDAGYGLIFVLAATLYKPRAKQNVRPVLTMLQYFGIATIIFGALTGILFGVRLYEKPMFSSIEEWFVNDQQLFNLSVIVGGFQIVFGMCLKVANQIKQKGFIHGVSTMGWILLALSSVGFFMLLPDTIQPALKPLYIGLAVLSGIMIIFFSQPGANIFVNLGQGLWEVYSNVTGLLGDFLSYIRLFAIGISTAILGFVFNQMAISLSPDIPVLGQLVFIIILVFGHGINIFMSSLGSLVHPMRLIFVEFYKNAGFTGGGKEYKPFAKVK